MDITYGATVVKINHSLLILEYKAVRRLEVFYTPMSQFVSVKGFYIAV